MIETTILALIVAAIGMLIAFFSLNHNMKTAEKDDTKENAEKHSSLQGQIDTISTVYMVRLDSIDDGIRDLKAERRIDSSNFNDRFDQLHHEILGVHDDSKHAIELAEAAHRRLDRAGIESAH